MKKFLAIIVALTSIGFLFHSCLPPEIEVESVTLNKTSVTLTVGEIESLTAMVLPEDATFPEVKWESSDPAVATVKEGYVTALKEGTAMIIATAWGVSAECLVSVVPQSVEVTSITLDKESLELEVGGLEQITATVDPAGAGKVEWTTSNSAVAQVTTDGTVVGIAEGTASITASLGGKFASCPVTVVKKSEGGEGGEGGEVTVTGIDLDVEQAEILEGNTLKINATITPAEAAGKTVTWTSSDNSIATVSNGLVTALKPGSVVITASCEGKTASCRLTITAATVSVTGVTVTPTTLTLVEGGKASLSATVLPANATNKEIGWSSSDDTVATVDANGQVTAVKEGTATITVTTVDGNKTATCTVTVVSEVVSVESVSVSPATLNLNKGQEATLTATVLPENATEKSVTWSSSDDSVATVDAGGKVTAGKEGTATITVTTVDGKKTATCVVTVTDEHIPVTKVILSETSISLKVGETYALTATVEPENATDKTITWSTLNYKKASIDNNGLVKALEEGEVRIKATCGEVTAYCLVTILPATVSVTGVDLSETSLSLLVGDKHTLTANVLPADASNKDVTWSSSDKKVATVSTSGEVTAVGAGTATITVTTANGGKTATCEVSVLDKEIYATSVSLSSSSLTLEVGQTSKLSATIRPSNTTNKTLRWYSYEEEIATVDANGLVKALKIGTATIRVLTSNGKHADCTVTVIAAKVPVSSVSLSQTELYLVVDETATLTATVLPNDATDKSVTWSSNNEAVATVNQNGVVTAVSAGPATITVTTNDGEKTATCSVIVAAMEPPVVHASSVQLSQTNLDMEEEETATLVATVLPEDAEDKSVTWSSDNEAVATVNQNGVVTAVSGGTATITVTTTDGNLTASCAVIVEAKESPVNPDEPDEPIITTIHVTSVSMDSGSLLLEVGSFLRLTATVLPDNATDKSVTWSSDNESIATVDQDGVVTAINVGTANITVTTTDGNYTASCPVKVFNSTTENPEPEPENP